MADPIDTDAIRADAKSVVHGHGLNAEALLLAPWWMTRVTDLCDEVDRLRSAIAAIPREGHSDCLPANEDINHKPGFCYGCAEPWPCPVERAHRLLEDNHD